MRDTRLFPLDGIRVLDLGRYISGPFATVLLAELGADVIKVESPDGDPFRKWESGKLSPEFVAFNRGKRSVVLDLKASRDKQLLFQLVESADVLVENFRPGVMRRLGIDYQALVPHNERLVYCNISGFGSTGPYSTMPAYDGVALGYSGLAGLLMDAEEPRIYGPALADAITGQYAALSILASLLRRERSMRAQHLEISMLAALAHFLPSQVSRKIMEDVDDGPYSRAQRSQAFAFAAKDRPLIIHLSSPPQFWENLCVALGRTDLMTDPLFSTRAQRIDNSEMLREALKPIFASRSRDEWLKVLREAEVPCAPVNSISEALADEQLQHLAIIDVLLESGLGPMPQIRPPIHWDGAVLPAVARAPLLGEHTEIVKAEVGR